MDPIELLDHARESHRRQEFADAVDGFAAVDAVAPLAIDDLERFAEDAHMLGRRDEAVRALQRVYQTHAEAGAIGPAVRTAFWLYLALGFNGEFAHAAGWIARAARLVRPRPDCDERGYLLVPEAERLLRNGEHAAALDAARRALEIADRCADRDLAVIACHLQGHVRIKQGRVGEGLTHFDEAMTAVAAGESSIRVTGWVYCSVIAACHELQELGRAREWTLALNAWCDGRPQFTGAYSGVCQVHRAELLQLSGAWSDAIREARLACEQPVQGYGEQVIGAASYRLGELHRLAGDLPAAETAYRRAGEHGWSTQPGLALLRLGQGRRETALAAIRRTLAETTDRLGRARLLPAQVEISLSTGDLGTARDGAAELTVIAEAYGTSALHARAAYARGAVQLADGAPEAALPALRLAGRLWHDLDVPYEVARTRVLVGLACRGLGDDDAALLELDAARRVFRRLGTAPDLARVDGLLPGRPAAEPAGLSRRELEVLRLVAAGKSNQAIAADLFLSEKTVARHVSNIFGKLRVGSRTAAAAFAFEHGIR
ncbi:LuxR C-terminal-related transcriptional regulator [Plantactinospora solaniradicis]|uniref:LuxR C-terminal-related transcriptional regulator n=1 Tax=Plantactinospora solaniradicis TaxID=1723736 RepID=A0ABW1KMM8_9ACTN